MILLTLLLLFGGDPVAQIADTEILQVMRTDEVFVRPDGQVYILNFSDARIQHYDAGGKLVRNIGRKGKGPGEFTFPSYVNLTGDRLYVWDELTNLISEFDLDGQFLRQVRVPSRGISLFRTTGGWFYFLRNQDNLEGSASVLSWTADDFKTKTELAPIGNSGQTEGVAIVTDGTTTKAVFSPLTVAPVGLVSPDGSRFYFADAATFHIDVYDGATGQKLYAIVKNEPRLPFDEDWADIGYREAVTDVHRQQPGLTITKLYPEYFPAIRGLAFDPEGNLVVDRWRGKPDDHHDPIAFNAKGEEVPLTYDWLVMRRLAGVASGQAYITILDEDSDAALAKVPLAEANRFVKEHPVSDWSQDRSIFY